jgi:hypothetical protein
VRALLCAAKPSARTSAIPSREAQGAASRDICSGNLRAVSERGIPRHAARHHLLIVSWILLCILLPPDAAAAEIKVASTKFITKPGSNFRITHALDQPDGTLLLSGWDDQNRLWVAKLSNEPRLLWQFSVNDGWRHTGIDLLFGTANAAWGVISQRTRDITADLRDRPTEWSATTTAVTQHFLGRFTDRGRPQQLVPISAVGEERFLDCAAQSADGFVLAGAIPAGPDAWDPLVPWIEKLDSNGQRLWTHSFPTDRDLVMNVRRPTEYCRRLRVSEDGTITWAMSVLMLKPAHSTEERTRILQDSTRNDSFTVIVQLDRDGTEMGRVRHPSADGGVLLDAGSDLLLVEHNYPAGLSKIRDSFGQARDLAALGQGVAAVIGANEASGTAITTFGPALSEKTMHNYPGGILSNAINAAARTPEGGLLLAGCVRDSAANFVMYIGRSGSPSKALTVSPAGGMQQCSLYQFGPGQRPGEATLLVANEVGGNRLLTLRYSD